MIARAVLSAPLIEFNAITGAPFHGPFSMYRPWRTTRVWEFAWAATVVRPKPGWRAADVGGALTGLAGVLAGVGLEVCIVDPDPLRNSPPALAKAHLSVTLHRCTVEDSSIPDDSLDIAYCLSVIEHIADLDDRLALVRGVYKRLKPGGYFVVTVDLFLGLAPFTDVAESANCRNVSVEDLVNAAPFELCVGERTEYYGSPGFEIDEILARTNAGEFLLGAGGILSQGLVLQKP